MTSSTRFSRILALTLAVLQVAAPAVSHAAANYQMRKAVPGLKVDAGSTSNSGSTDSSGTTPPPAATPLAKATWESTTLDFGGVPVSTTLTKTVKLFNEGNVAGSWTSLTALPTGVTADASTCSSVAPAQSCTVSFTYAPTTTTAYSASGIVPATGTATNSLSITGQGLTTQVGLSAGSLDLAATLVGATSTAASVQLVNLGNTVVSIGALSVTGPFDATTNCGSSLAVGASCEVSVTFSPTVRGAATGSLTLGTGAGAQSVDLTGTGNAQTDLFQSGTWDAALGTNNVSFSNGNLTVGVTGGVGNATGSARGNVGMTTGQYYWEVTINSWGGAYGPPLGITQATTASTVLNSANDVWFWTNQAKLCSGPMASYTCVTYGTGAVATDTFGFLYDGDAHTLTVSRNGVSTGVAKTGIVSGTWYPAAGASGGSYPANVTANFGATAFKYGPTATGTLSAVTSADFGAVGAGASVTRSFTYRNTGIAAATGVNASVSGSGLSLTANTCGTAGSPVSVETNATCSVTVAYTPTDASGLTGASVSVASASHATKTLALSGTSTVDASYGSVSMLLHMDGAAGTTAYPEARGATFTVGAGAPVISSTAMFGSGSGTFGSTGYIGSTSKPFATVGTGDFTMEFWVYLPAVGAIGDHDYVNFDVYPLQIGMGAGNKLYFEKYGGFWATLVSSSGLATGSWTHVAIARASGTTRMFFNGTSVASSASLNNVNVSQTGNTYIGARGGSGGTPSTRTATGSYYLDEVRFTPGVARYVSNFTSPTAPFASASTAALAGSIADLGSVPVGASSAATALTVTNTGTTSAVITSVTSTGSSQFVVSDASACVNAPVAAGGSCTAYVTFTPTAAGAQSGTVTVASNATNPSLNVSVSGSGFTATGRTVSITPAVNGVTYANLDAGPLVLSTAGTYTIKPLSSFSMTAKGWGGGATAAGGYAGGTMAVNSSQTLIARVDANGGLGGTNAANGGKGPNGGGLAGLFMTTATQANALLVAGGGGASAGGAAGAAGGAAGGSGGSSASCSGVMMYGAGGTQSAGGMGGTGFDTNTVAPGNGGALSGGVGGSVNNSSWGAGPGGGAGYFGGGGGAGGGSCKGGGGGGSSFVSGSMSATSNLAASGTTPGNAGDADRGTGGNTGNTVGRLVLR